MSSQTTLVWDDWLKNGTPYHDSDTFVEPQNFKDAVQFRTVVLAVKIDEPTTKKIRECSAKETQLSFILVIIASGVMQYIPPEKNKGIQAYVKISYKIVYKITKIVRAL